MNLRMITKTQNYHKSKTKDPVDLVFGYIEKSNPNLFSESSVPMFLDWMSNVEALEKAARVGYHEHEGFVEHPTAVRHHQEYFAGKTGVGGGVADKPSEALRPDAKYQDFRNSIKDVVTRTVDSHMGKFVPKNGKRYARDKQTVIENLLKEVVGDEYDKHLGAINGTLGDWKIGVTQGGASLLREVIGELEGVSLDHINKEIKGVIETSIKSEFIYDTPQNIQRRIGNAEDYYRGARRYKEYAKKALLVSSSLAREVLRRKFGPTIKVYRSVPKDLMSKIKGENPGLKEGDTFKINNGIVSAWTLSLEEAKLRTHEGMIISQTIPVDSVYFSDRVNSTWGGMVSEDEILFYLPNQTVKWDSSEGLPLSEKELESLFG